MDENEGLVQVVMLEDELVSTTRGPVRLTKGEKPWLEPWIASSLVGRGLAQYVVAEGSQSTVTIPDNLTSRTVADLRKLAQEHNVEDYNFMRKGDLVAKLESLRVENVSPAPGGTFEKIDLILPDADLGEPSQDYEKE